RLHSHGDRFLPALPSPYPFPQPLPGAEHAACAAQRGGGTSETCVDSVQDLPSKSNASAAKAAVQVSLARGAGASYASPGFATIGCAVHCASRKSRVGACAYHSVAREAA